jgi:hypothetical protein
MSSTTARRVTYIRPTSHRTAKYRKVRIMVRMASLFVVFCSGYIVITLVERAVGA